MSFRHFRFHQLFPLFSMLAAVLIHLTEAGYFARDSSIRGVAMNYAYFNVLFPSVLLFLIAYLIPVFISLQLNTRVSAILNGLGWLLCLTFLIVGIVRTALHMPVDLFPQRVDILLGVVAGIIFGITSARANE